MPASSPISNAGTARFGADRKLGRGESINRQNTLSMRVNPLKFSRFGKNDAAQEIQRKKGDNHGSYFQINNGIGPVVGPKNIPGTNFLDVVGGAKASEGGVGQ